MPLLKTQEELKHNLVAKVGSIQLPHDCKGRLLEIDLAKATEEFVRSMELRGWTLASIPGVKPNPKWVTDNDGRMVGYYAIDWLGDRTATKEAQKRRTQHGDPRFPTRPAHEGPLPTRRESSLEDTDGMVEYRCVGIFWAPELMIELLTSADDRKQQEKAAKNPVIFGPSGAPVHKV